MAWLIPIAAFLLGSIPFGYLLYRLATGGDVRRSGSGNIGATNVLRTGGKRLGVLTLLLDAGKGAAALALALALTPAWAWAALLAVIVGHMFTPWLGFRGGKGVATALGAFAVLTPWAALGAVVVFALLFAIWRYVSLASIVACVALPALIVAGVDGRTTSPLEWAAIAAAALIIARHHANIGRLLRGTESSFRRPRTPSANGVAR
jgi:glycerol-3-phosphate acyltransferase PlsY